MDSEEINILVIEDDEYVNKVISKELAAFNFRTHWVDSITHAKSYITDNKDKINLVLLDLKLSDGNGFTLVSFLKQHCPDVNIIIMSGHLSQRLITRAMQNGCYDLFEKPFSIKKDLIPIVKRHLNNLFLKKENSNLKEQLMQSSKLAGLGEMTATVVHDINGPVNTILMICDDLKEEIQHNKDLTQIDLNNEISKIQKGCEKIKKLVDHLRNYTRKDNTEKKENKGIESILEESLFMLKQKIRNHKILVKFDLDESISNLQLICYPNKIEQVFSNLMSNACDAMKDRDIRELTIKAKFENKILSISVQDTGTGIPKNIQDKIFQSFFTTKPKGEGTGLGLSIVKNIVLEHSGELTMSSEEGKGTVFTVKFPESTVQTPSTPHQAA